MQFEEKRNDIVIAHIGTRSLLVIFPTWIHPPTMAISRKYIERHIRGCGHVRIFVFGRDHVWIKWRHGTPAGADIHRSLRGLAVPIPQQLVARSLARGREKSWRASVCAWATYTLVRSWRGGGGRGDTWNTSRDTLLYLAMVRHVCRCHRWKHRGQAES